MASGLENITKLASAAPSIVPVDSKISLATASPSIAASYTFFESILSGGSDRKELGCVLFSKISSVVKRTPVADAYDSREPFFPVPSCNLPLGIIVVCPSSPAKPSCPYTSLPLATMPLPTPVPRVIIIKSFMPCAAPYIISPIAAALASLVNTTGILNLSSIMRASGIMPFQGRLGAYSMVPV